MLILASASPRRSELLTQAGFSFTIHPAHIPEDPYPNEDPIAYVTRLAREKAQAVFDCLSANPKIPGAPGPDFRTWDTTIPETPPGAPGPDFRTWDTMIPETPPGAPGPDFRTWDTTNLETKPGAPGLDCETGDTENPNSHRQVVLGADTTVTLDNQILGKPESPADAARMLRLLSGRTHRVITGIAIVTAEQTQTAAEITTVQFLPISEQEIAAYIATGEPMDKAGAYAIQGRAARWIPRIEGCYFNVVGLPIALVTSLLNSCNPHID